MDGWTGEQTDSGETSVPGRISRNVEVSVRVEDRVSHTTYV